MLKMKLQYFGHLIQRANSLGKKETLMLGMIEGRRRRRGDRGWDGWMASLTQWTWVWADSGRLWKTRKPGMLKSMGSAKSQTWLSDRTTTKFNIHTYLLSTFKPPNNNFPCTKNKNKEIQTYSPPLKRRDPNFHKSLHLSLGNIYSFSINNSIITSILYKLTCKINHHQ